MTGKNQYLFTSVLATLVVLTTGCGAPVAFNAAPAQTQTQASPTSQAPPPLVSAAPTTPTNPGCCVQYEIQLMAEPATVLAGSPTKLSWWTPIKTQLNITGLGLVDSPGSATINPTQTTTYTASGAGGDASFTVDVIQKATFNAKIKHIVFYVNENRSFDSYFGAMSSYRQRNNIPGYVDGFNPGVGLVDPYGHVVKPYHFASVCHEDLSPSWNESHYAIHPDGKGGFKMDRFLLNGLGGPETYDTHKTRAMGYYDERDLPYYYELASQYAMSDRFFSSILSATPPNRKFLFAGTSNGAINKQNPPPAVGEWQEKTIFQALNEKGIRWKYYYQDNSVFLANYSIWNDPFSQGLVRPISEYYDILARPTADDDFAQVVFIERAGQTGLDEHPLDNIQPGAANTKKIIDALMNSSIWQNSVFIYTYDEGGGLYDHVPPFTVVAPDDVPPQLQPDSLPGDFTLSGFRLPFIMVSPWVKPRFVSHVNRELTSILAFIEARFDVPPLTRRDAAADNMLEFFDFNSPPRLTIPPLPSQPTSGTCSYPAAIEPGHPMN